LDDFELVPDAMSPASINATRKPRDAASSATPDPVIPAPMTTTSYLELAIDVIASTR